MRHLLPLPSGREAEIRPPTIGDLEVVGVDRDRLARRLTLAVDGVDVRTGPWPVDYVDYSAIVAYVERLLNPTIEQIREVVASRCRIGAELTVATPSGRTATLKIPTVEAYQDATDYGRAGVQGGIRLLRRCLTAIDSMPVSYATLASSWPWDAPETLLLHAELVYLCSESPDARDAREGRVRVVA